MKTRRPSDETLESKPINPFDYREWIKTKFNIEITERDEKRYELVTTAIKIQFENSTFWKELTDKLRTFHTKYEIDNKYPLLQNLDKPELVPKPWESFFEKSIRHNVIFNNSFPNPPLGGWISPNNWYSKIRDIVRTTIIVKYLDGVHYLVGKTKTLCLPSEFHCDFEAKETGYYAAHMYFTKKLEIPGFDWETEIRPISLEIQIATQIQDVIRGLTHDYYEKRRSIVPTDSPFSWQWNYTSEDFIPNYLGHILHYVEGMIMEVRNRG